MMPIGTSRDGSNPVEHICSDRLHTTIPKRVRDSGERLRTQTKLNQNQTKSTYNGGKVRCGVKSESM